MNNKIKYFLTYNITMSSANPPYPYYNGIPFNPSFFTTGSGSGSGLTQIQANTLYLRKTVPDTATSQETFNAGIKTNAIDGTISSSIVALGDNITTGTLNLLCNSVASGALNLMYSVSSIQSGTINIGQYFTFPTIGKTTTNIRGDVNIGSIGATPSITINNPLTPAYTYPIASGKIGEIVSGTLIPPNLQAYANLVPKVLTTITLTPGIWLMSGSSIVNIPANSLVTQLETWIENNTTADVFSFSCILNQQNSTATDKFIAFPMSVSIYVSATATFSQKVNITFTGTAPTVNNYQFKTQAVRVA
jgi:hypothetical protein